MRSVDGYVDQEVQMSELAEYATRYQNARLTRDEKGVLEVALHTEGGPLLWSESVHRELGYLFADIGADAQNRGVILTGTGDAFCADISGGGWAGMEPSALWEKIYLEGKRLLDNLLNIDVPVIGAVNGPARVHAELAVLSDIVLAAETAVFQDAAHVPNGAVPGDGVHIVWPLLLGPNRGRYFLLTGEEISAQQALNLNVVAEVLPPARLLPRAHELASQLADKPVTTLRYTRVALTQRLKRHMLDDLGYGLMLEGRAAIAMSDPATRAWTGLEHRQV
jgi:enoyl-CoA hydratase/carnithine racemase